MNSLNTIRNVVNSALNILETAIADTSDRLGNQLMPGKANTIGAIYAHAILSLDSFTAALRDAPQRSVSASWADQLELGESKAFDWDMLTKKPWHIETLQAYAKEVYAVMETYLSNLSDAELSHSITLFGQKTTVEDTLALATWHTALHAGEIAALKGVSGHTGLPF